MAFSFAQHLKGLLSQRRWSRRNKKENKLQPIVKPSATVEDAAQHIANTNTVLKTRHQSRSPELPPELIRYILCCLDKHNQLAKVPWLQVMTFSLVCKAWYCQARPLLADSRFRSLRLSEMFYASDLHLLSHLLADSHALKLDYSQLIETIEFDLGTLFMMHHSRYNHGWLYEREQEDAVIRILELAPPKLRRLHIKIQFCGPDTASHYQRLFARLLPLCRTVKYLRLQGSYEPGEDEVEIPYLSDFVTKLGVGLETLELEGVWLSRSMKRALKKCELAGVLVAYYQVWCLSNPNFTTL